MLEIVLNLIISFIIINYPVICVFEYWCVFIGIYCYYRTRLLYSCNMVHRARNTYCNIHIGVYRFARKPHLQFIGQVIAVYHFTRCGYTRVYFFGKCP